MAKEFKLSALSVIAPCNTKTFSIVLAHQLGLNTAVYWNALADIGVKVDKKQKYDPQGFFKLDRAYVEAVTTLTPLQQMKCDQILAKEGILAIDESDPDRIAMSSIAAVALGMNGDFETVVAVAKERATNKAKNKTQLTDEERSAKMRGMVSALMNYVVEPDLEIHQAYSKWVEAMVGRINKTTVTNFVATIQAAKLDKPTTIFVIDRAAGNFWKDAAWTIEICMRDIAKNPALVAKPNQGGSGSKGGQAF